MKSRSRPFPCAIADKTVGISLRHGGGLGEPPTVYVRCEERDCQYVDLNQPPCPLRIEMFSDGSDRQTAEYLASHPGARICYACLTEVLGITHDQVRRASWRLKDEPAFSIRPARCVLCSRRRVTVALDGAAGPASAVVLSPTRAPAAASIADAVAGFLSGQAMFGFCAHCLARELNVPIVEVRDAMFALEREPTFPVRTAQCVSCLLTKRVIRYETPGSVDAPRQVMDLLLRSPGAAFCATCVAFSTDLALADTRRSVQTLAEASEFLRADAACTVCGRWQVTIQFRPDARTDAERVDEIGDVLRGHVRHRGSRIDLLSFRTAEGWRPFALVKAAAGSLVPGVPGIVLGLAPTRAEADELAAIKAREWIDKHVP